MKVFIYDSEGNGHFKFEADDYELQENEIIYNDVCEFREPKRNMTTGELYEGASDDVLNSYLTENISSYRELIYSEIEKLLDSSKARALGKQRQKLTKIQLSALEKFYISKNEVALQVLNDEAVVKTSIVELIEFEEQNDFAGEKLVNTINYLNSEYGLAIPTENITRIKMYCHLITAKFYLGTQLDSLLTDLCEVFRSKLITNLDNGQFDKIDTRIALIKTITDEMSITQIKQLQPIFDGI